MKSFTVTPGRRKRRRRTERSAPIVRRRSGRHGDGEVHGLPVVVQEESAERVVVVGQQIGKDETGEVGRPGEHDLVGCAQKLDTNGGGIGRATALAFARQRARLVLAARDREALAEVVDECQAQGAAALAVCTDVTRSEQMQALAAEAAAFGDGRIDIWINNAGVGAVGSFEQTPLEVHEQVRTPVIA